MAAPAPSSEPATSPDLARLELDRQRYELERRRLALEESWPRKWGSVLIGAGATVAVALAGLLANGFQQQARDQEVQLANKRAALELYFEYVADKPDDSPLKLAELKAISHVSGDKELEKVLVSGIVTLVPLRPPEQSIGMALAGAPNFTDKTAQQGYLPDDFTTFVQFHGPREADAQQVALALRALGYDVPGLESMDDRRSPRRNEIRIYREDQKAFARELAESLQQRTGIAFAVTGPLPGNLPNGVLEVWLGTGS
jgi:hypothetical protein